MAEDKRIPELPKDTSGAKDGQIAIHNSTNDVTERITVQGALGAIRADFDWQVGAAYAVDDLVLYGNLVWKSLQASNLGNVPSENAFWTNVPISKADGVTLTVWASGVFTYDDSIVVNNNAIYQLSAAAPFESTDFATELSAGSWTLLNG